MLPTKFFLLISSSIFFIPQQLMAAEPCPAKRSPFFASTIFQYYGGQNLELLNNNQSYDSYSFVQFIGDFGTHLAQPLPTTAKSTLTLDAVLRIKGNFGNAGYYMPTTATPIKIGWGATETAHTNSINRFLVWLRECAVTGSPQDEHTFFKIGLFPYKLGNGLILGNAYKITIPIPGQFIYPQIDQFRPGIQATVTNTKETFSATAYLGILETQSDGFKNTGSLTNTQNLATPFLQQGPTGSVLVTGECNFMRRFNDKNLVLNPYFLFHSNTHQSVEFPGDATSSLITPGFFASYEHGNIKTTFECAKNFGHQHVKAWDRNQLIHTNDLFNTQLFYVANPLITLATVTNNDFSPSPLVVRPNSITISQGNGTNFLYNPLPDVTVILKNSYNRLRKSYKNTYTGFLLYADLLIAFPHVTVGIAGGCASGDANPNDAQDTITMTRLTPGITYKDYDKKYRGFVSVNQLFEGKSINPLYFGQAQKLNEPLFLTDQLTTPLFTNQGFIGTTIQWDPATAKGALSVTGTAVAYFLDKPVTKGLSATLWQAQSLDFTPQMRTDMNTLLPKFLGTELNGSVTYTVGPELNFSLLGALFIPGSYYTKAAGKFIPLAAQEELALPSFYPDDNPLPGALGTSTSFFISLNVVCLFDFTRWRPLEKLYAKDTNA